MTITETYEDRLTREKAERYEKQCALTRLSLELAKHLDGWEPSPPRNEAETEQASTGGWFAQYAYLQKGEMRLDLVCGSYELKGDRIKVGVAHDGWPSYTAYDDNKGRPSKTRVTSHDLYPRRFLPEYERLWALCKAKAEKSQAYEDNKRGSWQAICRVLQTQPNWKVVHPTIADLGDCRLEQESDGAEIKFHVDAALLQRLVDVFGGIVK